MPVVHIPHLSNNPTVETMVPNGRVGPQCWNEDLQKIFKNLLKNYSARNAPTCVKASSGSVDFSLFKPWSLGVGWGHNVGMKFYTFMKVSRVSVDLSLFKS